VDGLVHLFLHTSGFYMIWVGGGSISITDMSIAKPFVFSLRSWFLFHMEMDYTKLRETHKTLKLLMFLQLAALGRHSPRLVMLF